MLAKNFGLKKLTIYKFYANRCRLVSMTFRFSFPYSVVRKVLPPVCNNMACVAFG